MLVAGFNTPKGFNPQYDENCTPIIVTLAQAMKMRYEGFRGTFEDVHLVFDYEEVEIKGIPNAPR